MDPFAPKDTLETSILVRVGRNHSGDDIREAMILLCRYSRSGEKYSPLSPISTLVFRIKLSYKTVSGDSNHGQAILLTCIRSLSS